MDAIKYLEERTRMCNEHPQCNACNFVIQTGIGCGKLERDEPARAVDVVKEWSNEQTKRIQSSRGKGYDALLRATLEIYAPIEVLSEYMGYRGDKNEDRATESSVLAKEGNNTARRAD